MRRLVRSVTVLALAALVLLPEIASAQGTPKAGGVFKAAMIGEPPSLDLHSTTAVIVQQITWHIYEGLYTYDKGYNAIPLLVDTHAVSDQGRTYTFKLRRGVKFHNGKELTSAALPAPRAVPSKAGTADGRTTGRRDGRRRRRRRPTRLTGCS